jgi:glycosyltransferase involved in cell wall biosynthesis
MRLLLITQKVNKHDPVLGFFHDWIVEFSKHIESLVVVCLEKGEHNLPDNVQVISLGKEKGFSKVRIVWNFFRVVVSRKYDKVFVHMNPEYVVLAGWWWRLLGKRVALWYTHKAVNLKLKIAVFFAHIIFSASQDSFRYKTSKLHIMNHGINISKFSQHTYVSDQDLKIISAGRISPYKDYKLLLCVAKKLKEESIPFSVDIFGSPISMSDEEYFNELKSFVIKNSLQDFVSFKGAVSHDDLIQKFSEYNLFVHMSKTGSLDKVTLEAMVSGVLVISSNDSTVAMMRQYPFLCYRYGDFSALYDNIKHLLQINVTKKEEIANHFYSVVKNNHSLDVLIKRIVFLLFK